MAQCPHCQATHQDSNLTHCPSCGHEMVPPAGQQQPQWQQQAAAFQGQALGAAKQAWEKAGPFAQKAMDQAAPVAREAWAKVQFYGPSKVAFGMMAASALFILWPSQRGIWSDFSWTSLGVMLLLTGYLAFREFTARDPLSHIWFATPAASAALFLLTLTGLRLKIASLLYIGGAGLLAYTILMPWSDYARAWGLDWRHALYGYRRTILLGAVVSFLSLFITWMPKVHSAGSWSGGYESRYSSYYGGYVSEYNSFKYFWPGVYFPAKNGINLSFAFFCLLALLACAAWASFVPRFEAPKWWKNVPFAAGGVALLFMLYQRQLYIGQLFFVAGLALIGWGAYNLCHKGVAEGQWDLRQVPLEKWLSRWL